MNLNAKNLFPGQQPNEKVYKLTRRHWFTLTLKIMTWLLFLAILMAFDQFVAPQFPVLAQSPYVEILSVFKTLYLMFLVAGLFLIWLIYYLNYQLITDERVVDVDQYNLLHHTISELHLSQIEDVTAEQKGLFGNLFNYGTVYIQTAGPTKMFELEHIPDPESVAKLILDLAEKFVKKHGKNN